MYFYKKFVYGKTPEPPVVSKQDAYYINLSIYYINIICVYIK